MQLTPDDVTALHLRWNSSRAAGEIPAAIQYRSAHGVGTFFLYAAFSPQACAQPELAALGECTVLFAQDAQTPEHWQVIFSGPDTPPEQRPAAEWTDGDMRAVCARFGVTIPA